MSTRKNAPAGFNSTNNAYSDGTCFPATTDVYTGAPAIGIAGIYAGRRLVLGQRVCTGSWRHDDGTRSYKFSRWITYEREMTFDYTVRGEKRTFRALLNGAALVPETAYVTLAIVKGRAA